MNIFNIKGQNIEEVIKDSIKEVIKELDGLEKNQTCLIYSSYLYNILKRKNVLVHLINTKDLGFNYEHQFLLVYDNSYYLIDLTYIQFGDNSLGDLNNNYYMLVDDDILKYYLFVVTNENKDITLSSAFLGVSHGIKRI